MTEHNPRTGTYDPSSFQSVRVTDFRRVGVKSTSTVMDLLGVLMGGWGILNGDEFASGFLKDAGLCLITNPAAADPSDRTVRVLGGVYLDFRVDSASLNPSTEKWEPAIRPHCFDESEVVLSARDGSNPRYDIVYFTPSVADEETVAGKRVRMSGPGSQATQSVDILDNWTGTIAVAEGTPAGSPSDPAVPAGGVELFRAIVPASSGAIQLEDLRDRARIFESALVPDQVSGLPVYGQGCVAGFAQGTHSGMTFVCQVGYVDAAGCRTLVWWNRVDIPAAPSTSSESRYDLVYMTTDTHLLSVTSGVETAGTPVPPAVPSGAVPLYLVLVENGDTSVADTDITDVRISGMKGGGQETQPTVLAKVTAEEQTAGLGRFINVQAVDRDGESIAVAAYFHVRVRDTDGTAPTSGVALLDPATGTAHTGSTGAFERVLRANSSGVLRVSVTNLTGVDATTVVEVSPCRFVDASDTGVAETSEQPSYAQHYAPGGPTYALLHILDAV